VAMLHRARRRRRHPAPRRLSDGGRFAGARHCPLARPLRSRPRRSRHLFSLLSTRHFSLRLRHRKR
jgi:hypothetical protein